MEDVAAIQQNLAGFAIHADARRRDQIEAFFAPQLTVDYSALTGGSPTQPTPRELVDGWRAFRPGFTTTHHLLGMPLIAVDGERATAEVTFTATHTIDDPALTGRDTWTLGGRYLMNLRKLDGEWKIQSVTLVKAWQAGNVELPAEATRRA